MNMIEDLFGGRGSIDVNIAAFICILSFAALLIALFVPSGFAAMGSATESLEKLVIGTLAYIFGKGSR